jgi:peptide/nickel transport system substrate-binding protein
MRTKVLALVGTLAVASMLLTACGAPTPETIIQTVVVEGTPMVVTPTAAPPAEVKSKDPTTFVEATIGEPDSLDPAWDYETAGGGIVANVYEGLVFYNKDKATEFIPQLATDWKLSADGMTYTFTIRKGVKFHDGADLTPGDVAYTFQRGLLQGGTSSPQWLLVQPLLGVAYMDVADLIDPALEDDPAGLAAADPAKLKAVCEAVVKTVVADDAAGTVTFNLAVPWGAFLGTIANGWGSIMDKDWTIQNGGWDGSCDTWQKFYGITSETDPLNAIMNGTGPFKFDHWTKGQEVVLVRNDNYWRTEPAWEGGPTGPAVLARVVVKKVDEWGTRFSMLQAGDADFALVPRPNIDQVEPMLGQLCEWNTASNAYDCKDVGDGAIRLFMGYPTPTRTDVFFNFKINVPETGNPFVGSGKLDGNGVPSDFFSDEHIRKAFNYCFDWETYNTEVLKGEAVQATSLFVPGMIGYDPNGPHYSMDLDKCAEEFKASTLKSPDGKSLWDVGFRMGMGYNTGNVERQTISEILSSNINQVNNKFVIEVVGLPWPTFLATYRAKQLPIFTSGWLEDIHDPSNWVVPFATSTGAYSGRQSLPKTLTSEFETLAAQAAVETDAAKRDAEYKAIYQKYYELAPVILGSVALGRHYEQRWVQGWYYNPIYSDQYFYVLSKQ